MADYLVIDLTALLDKSKVGAESAKHLEATWTESQVRHQKLKEQAKGATGPALKAVQQQVSDFERESLHTLEQKRASLRDKLIERARPVVRELATAAGAKLVLEKSAVAYLADDKLDITAQVIAKVDAQGPLKA
ncbi:MAG: OmpH family outer membrane protein [Myxococcaceae bacterium]